MSFDSHPNPGTVISTEFYLWSDFWGTKSWLNEISVEFELLNWKLVNESARKFEASMEVDDGAPSLDVNIIMQYNAFKWWDKENKIPETWCHKRQWFNSMVIFSDRNDISRMNKHWPIYHWGPLYQSHILNYQQEYSKLGNGSFLRCLGPWMNLLPTVWQTTFKVMVTFLNSSSKLLTLLNSSWGRV